MPVYRWPFLPDEETSFRHLLHYLGGYDKYVIAPQSLRLDMPGFGIRQFEDRFFVSIQGYSSLLLTKEFYRTFAGYEYILIYQLDCLVFSSDLRFWCQKAWDYIGAPWFRNWQNDPTDGFWKVGNGGLSLRNVEASLAVLNSRRLFHDPEVRSRETRFFKSSPRLKSLVCRVKKEFHKHGYKNSVGWRIRQLCERVDVHEDKFWSLDAPVFRPEFRIPTPREALPFSFEMAPRYCFKENGGRLPFGCHAWAKFDRAFWEPYLLKSP